MRFRSLILAAFGGAFILSASAPAFADHDDHRRDEHATRDHRGYHDYRPEERGYYAPPVVVAPPPYAYYAPPPLVSPPPGISIGITLP